MIKVRVTLFGGTKSRVDGYADRIAFIETHTGVVVS